jgi:hypothetical protein
VARRPCDGMYDAGRDTPDKQAHPQPLILNS